MAGEGKSSSPCLNLQDVVVQQDTYMEDFRTHLLPAIRPSWKDLSLGSKVFDSGITNALVAIFDKEKGLEGSREDVVLVRINGIGTEIIIDRVDELVCLVELNKVGLFPPVYAQFKNGLCYGYYPGRQVGVAEVREEGMSRKIAGVLARLHCVEIPRHFQGREPVMWEKLSKCLGKIPEPYEDLHKQNSFTTQFGSLSSLKHEVAWLRGVVSTSCHTPIVFSHNDTLIANFIYDKVTGSVGLVDYEYGGPNYLAFDIANHFCEFAGVEEVNFDLYPDETFQKQWLRVYLVERAQLTGEEADTVTEESIDSLYKEVQIFALASHLFWAVWALIQTIHSKIDFNYMEYAGLRYGEYCRMKKSLSLAN